MDGGLKIEPFDHCPPLDGYHCQTNSLAKMFHFYEHPLSEDLLLGLGAGMGFIYWRMKMGPSTSIFIGGRGNNKDFFTDVGRRTGVQVRAVSTSSARRAEAALLARLEGKEPAMVFGDMGFLPWFDFPQEYHFGGHTFVVCGYDGDNTVLASDMDPEASGLKKGFYAPITLAQLSMARGSAFKPFPPKNTYLDFDFGTYHEPGTADVYAAIRQTVEAGLNPPLRNMGVKGLRHAGTELLKWPEMLSEGDLRMNLFGIYLFIEVGGTGGGCFRYMYSRFLKESANITSNAQLLKPAEGLQRAGEMLTEIGLLFKDAVKADDCGRRIEKASPKFHAVAELEENVYSQLARSIE